MNALMGIQKWYSSCCDGDWEHSYGIKIETLDNPGWSVDIDLIGTPLESKPFETIKCEVNEQDWWHCFVENGVFRGRGGQKNLSSILETFCTWAFANADEG